MCSTWAPRATSASATRERWQRQGTASAHIRATVALRGQRAQLREPGLELLGHHVVGEAAEAGVAPAGVGESLRARRSPPSSREMHVANTSPPQRRAESASPLNCGLCRERGMVRMSASTRHVERAEQRDQLVERPRRMADRVDPNASPALRAAHSAPCLGWRDAQQRSEIFTHYMFGRAELPLVRARRTVPIVSGVFIFHPFAIRSPILSRSGRRSPDRCCASTEARAAAQARRRPPSGVRRRWTPAGHAAHRP